MTSSDQSGGVADTGIQWRTEDNPEIVYRVTVGNQQMNRIVIGIGEYAVASRSDERIKTYGLGSCLAVVIHNPYREVTGMVHIALPDSTIDREKARKHPGYFADTGIPLLLQTMNAITERENPTGLVVKIVGGASVLRPPNTFNIGTRNTTAVHHILAACGLTAAASDVGGAASRTVEVYARDGAVSIRDSHGRIRLL